MYLKLEIRVVCREFLPLLNQMLKYTMKFDGSESLVFIELTVFYLKINNEEHLRRLLFSFLGRVGFWYYAIDLLSSIRIDMFFLMGLHRKLAHVTILF